MPRTPSASARSSKKWVLRRTRYKKLLPLGTGHTNIAALRPISRSWGANEGQACLAVRVIFHGPRPVCSGLGQYTDACRTAPRRGHFVRLIANIHPGAATVYSCPAAINLLRRTDASICSSVWFQRGALLLFDGGQRYANVARIHKTPSQAITFGPKCRHLQDGAGGTDRIACHHGSAARASGAGC